MTLLMHIYTNSESPSPAGKCFRSCAITVYIDYGCIRFLPKVQRSFAFSMCPQFETVCHLRSRPSYAFTSSPFSVHDRHILPTSNIDILVVHYLFSNSIDISEQHIMWELWTQFFGLTLPLRGTPVNNHIKLISPETRVPGLQILPLTVWA